MIMVHYMYTVSGEKTIYPPYMSICVTELTTDLQGQNLGFAAAG
jgi:hypothetical protein